MTVNYHTHTRLCGHAVGETREYIEAAIRSGIKKLGFSDHCPQFFDGDYVSGIRMKPSEAEGYVNSIRELAEEYKNDIELFIGFEAEYFPPIFHRLQDFCRNYGVDYLILGQHCLTDESNTDRWVSTPSDDKEQLIRYVDEVLEGLSTGSFSYLCHPDVFRYIGDDNDLYVSEMKRLCRGAKELDIPLEINLRGMNLGWHYPNDRFFSIAAAEGNSFIFGVDAHDPIELTDLDAHKRAELFAKKHGITVLDDIKLRKI